MSWKRTMGLPVPPRMKRKEQKTGTVSGLTQKDNYASYLPEIYTGMTNRVERYQTYEQMDLDPEIQTSLNVVADFCTQNTEDFDIPFQISYADKMGDTEVYTIENRLNAWCVMNKIRSRVRKIVRNTLKYGDCIFIRDPETFKLYHVHPSNVIGVVLNESTGKTPLIYYIRNVHYNVAQRVMAANTRSAVANNTMFGTSYGKVNTGGMMNNTTAFNSLPTMGSQFKNSQMDVMAVDARHVFHISLNDGMDNDIYPFGESVLERAYKTYKQKELLEDSAIIYRTQRAPERRVFKIDVGDTPPDRAMSVVEQFKTSLHQKRVPSSKGGSSTLIDAAYNPLSMLEDYYVPVTADGKGSSIETLPGGDNLGQIDDLRYFNNQLIRLLGIPSSYIPFGPEDGAVMFSDGSRSLIQEHRFNKQCQAFQFIIAEYIDREFKVYLNNAGYNINPLSFTVNFLPPMNFASYRKAEMEKTLIDTYLPLMELPFISKQFVLEKIGFSKEDILRNEQYLMQELGIKGENLRTQEQQNIGLDSVGITSPTMDSEFEDDLDLDIGDEPTSTDGADDIGGENLDDIL